MLRRESEWTEATRTHDFAALDEILAPEYRLTFVHLINRPGRTGKPEVTREMWLENTQGMTFGSIEIHNQNVTMHGDQIAIVRMRMHRPQCHRVGGPIR